MNVNYNSVGRQCGKSETIYNLLKNISEADLPVNMPEYSDHTTISTEQYKALLNDTKFNSKLTWKERLG